MADLSHISDADLSALYQPSSPLAGMSDADLSALHAQNVPQITGAAREVAMPASNVAKGVISALALPGDVARGVTMLGGAKAVGDLQGNPFPDAQSNYGASMAPRQMVTPQMLAAAPGRSDIPAPTGHNPLDSESLYGLGKLAGVIDRPDLQPQSAREKYEGAAFQGVGAALPMIATGGAQPISALAKSLMQGGAAGAGSAIGGDLGAAVGGVPGQVIGTGLGALAGARQAPGGGGNIASLIPSGMDAETAALAQVARNHGINVSLGQASSTPFVKYADSVARRMPFSGYGNFDRGQQAAFNSAVTKTFGENADKITPAVLDAAQTRIGGVMNGVAARTSAPFDSALQGELGHINDLAVMSGLQPGQADAVGRQLDNIAGHALQNGGSLAPGVSIQKLQPGELIRHVTGGTIPGNVYQNLTKRGEALDLLQGNRSTTAGQLGGQIRDSLDSALSRGASPADLALLQDARTQYKALKTVQPLTMRADALGGATPTTGDISAAGLLGRVNQQYPTAAMQGLGEIPLKDLAQVGQRFLKEPPSSGTSERMSVGHLAELGGALAAPLLGEHAGVPLSYSVPPLAAAMIAPRMIGSVMRSPALPAGDQTPLLNALMGGSPQIQQMAGPRAISTPTSNYPAIPYQPGALGSATFANLGQK